MASGGENGIASRSAFPQAALMNTVQEIEVAITHLSLAEMRQVHEWLEDALEDQLAFTGEFQARIERSEKEMAAGLKPRVRLP